VVPVLQVVVVGGLPAWVVVYLRLQMSPSSVMVTVDIQTEYDECFGNVSK